MQICSYSFLSHSKLGPSLSDGCAGTSGIFPSSRTGTRLKKGIIYREYGTAELLIVVVSNETTQTLMSIVYNIKQSNISLGCTDDIF